MYFVNLVFSIRELREYIFDLADDYKIIRSINKQSYEFIEKVLVGNHTAQNYPHVLLLEGKPILAIRSFFMTNKQRGCSIRPEKFLSVACKAPHCGIVKMILHKYGKINTGDAMDFLYGVFNMYDICKTDMKPLDSNSSPATIKLHQYSKVLDLLADASCMPPKNRPINPAVANSIKLAKGHWWHWAREPRCIIDASRWDNIEIASLILERRWFSIHQSLYDLCKMLSLRIAIMIARKRIPRDTFTA